MKSTYLTFLVLMVSLSAHSQSPISDAAGLAHNVNVPVNLYNGSASIDVPLYSIPANNGSSVPVGLSYNASGIKVKEPASSVGLGWDLYAGGAITRIVRGKPDIATASVNPDGTTIAGVMSQVWAGKDSERDLFYYSFPGGGGKFVMDENLTDIYTLPYTDIDISFDVTNNKFTIRDPYGNEYIYSTTETGYYNETSGSTYPNSDIHYTATWHLSKINFLGQPDSKGITFLYTVLGESSGERSIAYKDVRVACNQTSYTEYGNGKLRIKTRTIGRRLDRIQFPRGEVIFLFGINNREDLPGSKPLAGIIVKDDDLNVVQQYTFNTSYFNAGDSFYKNDTYNDKNGGSCTAPECKRLKLESIDLELSGQTLNYRTFDYSNDKTFHSTQGWDLYELPRRDSEYYDHWGYFTHDNTTTYNEYTYSPYNSGGNNFSVSGMNRAPTAYVMANLLTKMVLPTGGYTTIEYQAHGASWGSGARIWKIKTFDEDNVLSGGKEYTYAGIETNGSINYAYKRGAETISCYNTSTQSYEPKSVDILRFYSYSLNNFLDMGGPNTGYGKVTETDLKGNGSVEHFFLNFSDRTESSPVKSVYIATSTGGTQGTILSSNGPPFSGKSMTYYDRGGEYLTRVYDQTGTLLSETETIFNKENTLVNTQKNVTAFHEEIIGNSKKYIISEYTIKSRPVIVTSTRSTSYEGAQSIINNTYYYYHSSYPTLLLRTETVDADGNRYRTKMRYHHDIITSPISTSAAADVKGLDALRVNKANGIPIETVSSVQKAGSSTYLVLGASFGTFKEYGSTDKFVGHYQSRSLALAAPTSTGFTETSLNTAKTTFVIDSDYRLTNTLNSFDTNGNLTSSTGGDGITTTYAYDATGDYMLSKSANGFTTAYEHYPLVGIHRVTDPNNKVTEYEYDGLQRLRMVRYDGEILERHRYHYAGDDESISGAISLNLPSGQYSFRVNKIASFSSNQTLTYHSKTKYIWDFGDGEVSEAFGSSANHTYTQTGSYAVRLTLINPDFDPIQVLRVICITTDGSLCNFPE